MLQPANENAWLATVASAAPPLPIFITITNTISRIMLPTAAIAINMKGRTESPIPLSTALITL